MKKSTRMYMSVLNRITVLIYISFCCIGSVISQTKFYGNKIFVFELPDDDYFAYTQEELDNINKAESKSDWNRYIGGFYKEVNEDDLIVVLFQILAKGTYNFKSYEEVYEKLFTNEVKQKALDKYGGLSVVQTINRETNSILSEMPQKSGIMSLSYMYPFNGGFVTMKIFTPIKLSSDFKDKMNKTITINEKYVGVPVRRWYEEMDWTSVGLRAITAPFMPGPPRFKSKIKNY